MLLAQLPLTYLENLLLENPKAQFFSLGVSDFPFSTFPQGVPRASVLAAYQTAAMQLGNFNLVPLGSDNFQRPNQVLTGPTWSNTGPQIISGQCWSAGTASDSSAVFL